MDGIIIINKPSGLSSSNVTTQAKKILCLKKVGHLGTLDPLATGVLPLCVNEGTKLVPFLLEGEKEYIGQLKFGIETDSQDIHGSVVRRSDHIPRDTVEISKVFQQFRGEILQTPPMFSALKYKGVPLYKIARQGISVPRKARKVRIFTIEILAFELPLVTFRVVCSHGTYIRTLCSDIGRRLSCGAHLVALMRIRNGAFHINDSIKLEELKHKQQNGTITEHILSPNDALRDLPAITVDDTLKRMIQNGVRLTVKDIDGTKLQSLKLGQKIKIISSDGRLIGIAESLVNGDALSLHFNKLYAWKILRVFNVGNNK